MEIYYGGLYKQIENTVDIQPEYLQKHITWGVIHPKYYQFIAYDWVDNIMS